MSGKLINVSQKLPSFEGLGLTVALLLRIFKQKPYDVQESGERVLF